MFRSFVSTRERVKNGSGQGNKTVPKSSRGSRWTCQCQKGASVRGLVTKYRANARNMDREQPTNHHYYNLILTVPNI